MTILSKLSPKGIFRSNQHSTYSFPLFLAGGKGGRTVRDLGSKGVKTRDFVIKY